MKVSAMIYLRNELDCYIKVKKTCPNPLSVLFMNIHTFLTENVQKISIELGRFTSGYITNYIIKT